jgi:hypothetical protein
MMTSAFRSIHSNCPPDASLPLASLLPCSSSSLSPMLLTPTALHLNLPAPFMVTASLHPLTFSSPHHLKQISITFGPFKHLQINSVSYLNSLSPPNDFPSISLSTYSTQYFSALCKTTPHSANSVSAFSSQFTPTADPKSYALRVSTVLAVIAPADSTVFLPTPSSLSPCCY